ncbi:MAG: hypothetical protein QOD77_462 [Thermoplasmata archaeon]|nr:hypothetical protein [Thermoplasmata archaeon]
MDDAVRLAPALALPLLLAALSGCAATKDDAVREFEIHIGWNADGTTQYLTPAEIRVPQGAKVRFVITNDDDPNKDYNGAGSGKDNFHDVAFEYGGQLIEHEVPAGGTASTCLRHVVPCPEGQDFFVASTKGTFKLYCEVGGGLGKNPDGSPKTRHEQAGMKGVLIVE